MVFDVDEYYPLVLLRLFLVKKEREEIDNAARTVALVSVNGFCVIMKGGFVLGSNLQVPQSFYYAYEFVFFDAFCF